MKTDNRNAIIDLIRILIILITIGAALGALYKADWKIEHKIIVFSFIFLLGLIANEITRVFNGSMKSLDTLMLIFIQLRLIGKKQGVKEDAGKIKEELETGMKKKMEFERKAFDFEFLIIIVAIAVVFGSAYITTILI
tara:strand:- start:23 stop:436 length:414 start_codon:yes stop_codon:yes gene_type:complete